MEPLWNSWQTHWDKAQAHGVITSIVAGADQVSCQRGLEIAKQAPKLLVALGFHPEVYDLRVLELTSQNLSDSDILAQTAQSLTADIDSAV
jgi:Tat protein secretion system quality control protein TatD with DNase activity